MGDNELILTPAEVGKILKLSMPTTYNMISQGQIPSLRYGRKIVIPRAAFLKTLEAAGSGKEG